MKRILAGILLCLLTQPAYAADKWLSVRSKNFLLVGNATEAEIRRVGRFFEEYRNAFGTLFPKVQQSPSAPTTILVFKNDDSLKPFKTGTGSTFFHGNDDENLILVTPVLTATRTALHDYAHSIMRDAADALPVWAAEGLAEAFSTFGVGTKQNEFILGNVSDAHIATLSKTPLLTLKTLFEQQDRGSIYYNETSRQGIMYAQSWALMHYFLLGPNAKRRPQLAQFLASLASGTPTDDAFLEAFETDYPTLEDEFKAYISHPWPNLRIVSNGDLQVDVKAIPTRTLSEAEAEFYLADALVRTNRLQEAETHLKTALMKDPNLSNAHASLAMIRMRQQKPQEARALLQKALEIDPKNFLFNYHYAGIEGTDKATIRRSLNTSIEAAPRFVAAHALLASTNIAAGENLAETETLLKRAVAIAPGREDFRFLLAQTYSGLGRTADATALLRTLQRVTSDPDLKRKTATLLDELAPGQQVFTEIRPDVIPSEIAKEVPVEIPHEVPAAQPSARATILEPLVPIAPSVQGEKVNGLLVLIECANGVTLRIQTGRTTVDLHTTNPTQIQFLSYTSNVTDNIQCGPRNPGTPVSVTYRPVPGGLGEPLVVEFTESK